MLSILYLGVSVYKLILYYFTQVRTDDTKDGVQEAASTSQEDGDRHYTSKISNILTVCGTSCDTDCNHGSLDNRTNHSIEELIGNVHNIILNHQQEVEQLERSITLDKARQMRLLEKRLAARRNRRLMIESPDDQRAL